MSKFFPKGPRKYYPRVCGAVAYGSWSLVNLSMGKVWVAGIWSLMTGFWIKSLNDIRRVNGFHWQTEKNNQNSNPSTGTESASGGTGEGARAINPYTRKTTSLGFPKITREERLLFRLKHMSVDKDTMPILAARGARLEYKLSNDTLAFKSVARDDTFGIDEDAVCSLGRAHKVPNLGCSCGFYALPADTIDEVWMGNVVLLVELSGVVIECDKGYRAGHQKVIECKLGKKCGMCKINYATSVGFFNGTDVIMPLCDHCHKYHVTTYRPASPDYRPEVFGAPLRTFTIDELQEKLGVKVTT